MDLKQLSASLGLSPTTVSRALNGYADVSEVTRARVLEAAARLGYQPNAHARRLAIGKADAVGLVYPTGVDDLNDPRFDFERVIPECREFFHAQGIADDAIPLIAAGGINSHERIIELQALGAAGVQLGTAFAVTEEGDAAPGFKATLAGAKPEDIVEFMSVAGLPARAVRTHWLDNYLRHLPKLQAAAHRKLRCTLHFDCLLQCGLRDGVARIGQFCIDTQLAAALRGDVHKGLFFRGASALPFGAQVRPVRDLVDHLMTGKRTSGAQERAPISRR